MTNKAKKPTKEMTEAQMVGLPTLKIDTSAGQSRSYRIPHEVCWAKNDTITWYTLGDPDPIRDLLVWATHLGKKRGSGRGSVLRWAVESTEPWGEGFPIVRDQKPMRPLPPDWKGLQNPKFQYATLTYPYYRHEHEVLCAVPE